jgi:hypothetical protein
VILVAIPNEEGFFAQEDGTIWTRLIKVRVWRAPSVWVKGSAWREVIPDNATRRPYVKLRTRRRYVAHLILEAFVGPCPDGMECCHKDDDPSNSRLDNLRWDTHAANISECRKSDRRGDLHPRARVYDHDVASIRADHAGGMTREALMRKYNLPAYTVRDIVLRRSYKHV